MTKYDLIMYLCERAQVNIKFVAALREVTPENDFDYRLHILEHSNNLIATARALESC